MTGFGSNVLLHDWPPGLDGFCFVHHFSFVLKDRFEYQDALWT